MPSFFTSCCTCEITLALLEACRAPAKVNSATFSHFAEACRLSTIFTDHFRFGHDKSLSIYCCLRSYFTKPLGREGNASSTCPEFCHFVLFALKTGLNKQTVFTYIYGYGWGKPLTNSWKLATLPQVKGVLLSENPMRGATAQDPPTDRLQTRVCSGLHQQQVCTLAPKGGNSIHTLCLSQRGTASDDLQNLEAIGSFGL